MDVKRKGEKAKEKTIHQGKFREILTATYLLKAMIFLWMVMMKLMLMVAENDC
jgi:hypothetical protein